MRTRTLTTSIALATAALALAACNPNSTTDSKNSSNSITSTTTKTAATKPVPHLIGKGLQAAQDAAQAAGFYSLTSHDALGRDRSQILDRDWKVCTQTPAGGTPAQTSTRLDFGAVKLTEACPKGGEIKAPAKTGKTMPSFIGKGLAAARNSLPSDASITTKDATGSRIIILESDWKVCSQDPKPGAAYTGQPVTLTAVKTDETCP